MTAPGTPYLLQGEEIGMTNVAFPSIEDYNDIHMRTAYRVRVEAGEDPQATLEDMRPKSRDNARTPMQWSAQPHAGFTSGKPWIGVNPNYREINVEGERNNPDSVYHFYRTLIRLRKENPALVYGDYRVYRENDPVLHMFTRSEKNHALLIILNHASAAYACATPAELMTTNWRLRCANYTGAPPAFGARLELRPWEARIYAVTDPSLSKWTSGILPADFRTGSTHSAVRYEHFFHNAALKHPVFVELMQPTGYIG